MNSVNKTIKAGLLLSSVLVLAACSGADNSDKGSQESTKTEQVGQFGTVGDINYEGFNPTEQEVGLVDYDKYVGDWEALSELLGDNYLSVDYKEDADITEVNGVPLAEHLEDLNYEVSYESAKEITGYSYLFKGLSEEEQEMYMKMVYTHSGLTASAGTQILSFTKTNADKLATFFVDLKEETGIELVTLDALLQLIMVDAESEDAKTISESEAYNTFFDGFLDDTYTIDVSALSTDEAVEAEYKAHREDVLDREFTDTIKGADLNYIHDMVNHLRLARIVITSSAKDEMSDEELEVFFNKLAEEEEALAEDAASETEEVLEVEESVEESTDSAE